jgi:hypothetical protein
MAKASLRQSKQNVLKRKKAEQAEEARETRSARAQEEHEEAVERSAPAREARQVRNDALREQMNAARQRELDAAAQAEEEEDEKDVALLDEKPGSGSGLKPGDYFAPTSNPGAAARVPVQPLQPESLQSHGKGIVFDKDLDNPPYGTDDPEAVDAGPSGSNPRFVDKEAEVEKAEKATSRYKTSDPDNPAIGRGGKKDATASPNPIGSHRASKNAVAGGSNSGVD